MKRHLLSGFALSAVLAGRAVAADMPPPMAPAPPVIAYGWTGFYMGVNFGLSFARSRHTTEAFNLGSGVTTAENFTSSVPGLAGGGQVGVNWQAAPSWVLGIEADLQGSTQTVLDCILQCSPAIREDITHSLDWFATVRGRLGWTNGPALFYVTGGWAAAKVTTDVLVSSPGNGPDVRGSISETKHGWTAGGGIEAQLVGNLTGKVEYLYIDLGSTQSGPFIQPILGGAGTRFTFSNSNIQDHVVRLGLNYKFGGPLYVAPAPGGGVYKASPVAVSTVNWSGIYIGGNAGVSLGHHATLTTDERDFFTFTAVTQNPQLHLSPLGAVFGGQVGINWQALPRWVMGVEADFQGARQSDSICVGGLIAGCLGSSNGETLTLAQRLPWFGTVRARSGYAHGPALFYVTGGLAYGRIITDVGLSHPATLVTASASLTQDKAGWTAGGGIEARLVGNLTGKLEYLYLDLGTVEGATNTTTSVFIRSGTISYSSRVQDHVIRVGLNYLFDWSDPVSARY